MRHLFVYWKVPAAQAEAALVAARSWQAELRGRHPALQAGLFRRSDVTADRATVMETYTTPTGVSDELAAEIETVASRAMTPMGQPPRHIESFDAVGD